jgi:hypothetical protein
VRLVPGATRGGDIRLSALRSHPPWVGRQGASLTALGRWRGRLDTQRSADTTAVSELAITRAGPVARLDTRFASRVAGVASDQGSAVSLAYRSVGVVALAAALRVPSTPTAIAIATTAIVMSNA